MALEKLASLTLAPLQANRIQSPLIPIAFSTKLPSNTALPVNRTMPVLVIPSVLYYGALSTVSAPSTVSSVTNLQVAQTVIAQPKDVVQIWG